jgi:hypothetical protein
MMSEKDFCESVEEAFQAEVTKPWPRRLLAGKPAPEYGRGGISRVFGPMNGTVPQPVTLGTSTSEPGAAAEIAAHLERDFQRFADSDRFDSFTSVGVPEVWSSDRGTKFIWAARVSP